MSEPLDIMTADPTSPLLSSVTRESEAIDKLAGALAKAQGVMENPTRNREVTVTPKFGRPYKYRYATMDRVRDAYRNPLSKNGLSISAELTPGGYVSILHVRLMHESGQWRESVVAIPNKKLTNEGQIVDKTAQEIGAQLTYFRRYLIAGLLDIVAEDDNDGHDPDGGELEAASPSGRREALTDLLDRLKQEISELQTLDTKDKLWAAQRQARAQLKTGAYKLFNDYLAAFHARVDELRAASNTSATAGRLLKVADQIARAEAIIDGKGPPKPEPTTAEVLGDEIPALKLSKDDEWLEEMRREIANIKNPTAIAHLHSRQDVVKVLDGASDQLKWQFQKLIDDAENGLFWISAILRDITSKEELAAFLKNKDVEVAYKAARKQDNLDAIGRIDAEYEQKAKDLGVPHKKQKQESTPQP